MTAEYVEELTDVVANDNDLELVRNLGHIERFSEGVNHFRPKFTDFAVFGRFLECAIKYLCVVVEAPLSALFLKVGVCEKLPQHLAALKENFNGKWMKLILDRAAVIEAVHKYGVVYPDVDLRLFLCDEVDEANYAVDVALYTACVGFEDGVLNVHYVVHELFRDCCVSNSFIDGPSDDIEDFPDVPVRHRDLRDEVQEVSHVRCKNA